MKRKIFSIVLSLCMVLTMMPMATGVAWADTASSVSIGTAVLNAENPYYHNGTNSSTGEADGSQGSANNDPTDANATFSSGTLTLNGLNLTSGSRQDLINANGDIAIKLEGENTLENNSNYGGCAIYVDGILKISESGKLHAYNGNHNTTTIYASESIEINGAEVTAIKAGGDAQAIHAERGAIVITDSATVVATNNGTSQKSYALLAGNIQNGNNINVSNGATLIATSGTQAVSGSVNIDTNNSTVTAGETEDTATSWPRDNGSSELGDLNNYKYLKIEPKAPEALALEGRTFGYAYDAWRAPA